MAGKMTATWFGEKTLNYPLSRYRVSSVYALANSEKAGKIYHPTRFEKTKL
jgi:hypothetical protein